MYTAGIVTVAKKGTLIAEVRAEGVVVKGEIKGPVTSRGPVSLEKGGRIFGNVTSPTLKVQEGSQLVGMVVTGPRVPELLAEIEAATAQPAKVPA
jgi:cytoskeletal protein CcmA (bactofilin family)